MPCWTIRTTTVDLSAMGRIDAQLLADAITALGYKASVYSDGKTVMADGVTYQNGQLTVTGRARNQITLDKVKRQYGVAVVKATAKRFGWQLQEVNESTTSKQLRRL